MSTNHNRIRVADLEINEPNKILKTNEKGELEFNDVSELQTEKYNALDCTTQGKALDARQGKVLKDMIDKNSVNFATDLETQINTAISEDKKVISRLKLFNWWQWIKSQSQTILGSWTFNSSLNFGTSGYFTSDSTRLYIRALTGKNLQIGVEGTPNDAIAITSNGIFFRNGLTLTSNNITTPPLIISSGALTNVPQNGAIERDENGQLWETHGGVRSLISGGTKSQKCKVYTAIINQSGTNPPVATVLENTLNGNISFEYSSRGNYTGSLTNAFPEGKTFFITVAPNAPGSSNMFYIGRVDNNSISLSFRKNMTAFDEIVNAMLEIRVYE